MDSSVLKGRIWKKIVPGIIFFGGLIGLIFNGQRNQFLLKAYPRYTIGSTTKTYWTFASGKQLEYGFYIQNKYYKNSDRYKDNTIVPDGKYYVKFYTDDPNISEILQDRPVKDSIKKAPFEGWEKIPE